MSARCRTTIALPRPTPRDACSRRLPCASARTRCSSAALPDGSRTSRSTSTASAPPPTRSSRPSGRTTRRSISPSTPAGAFSAGGLDRWASIVPMAPWMDAAGMARAAFDLAIVSVLLDAGARAGLALRGRQDGRDLFEVGRACRGELRDVHFGRLLEPPRRSLPGRRGGADRADAAGACERLPGRAAEPAPRGSKAVPGSSTGSAAWWRSIPKPLGASTARVPVGLLRPSRGQGAGRHRFGTAHPRSDPAASRRDLAGAHHARWARTRRHLALSARGARARGGRRDTPRLLWKNCVGRSDSP